MNESVAAAAGGHVVIPFAQIADDARAEAATRITAAMIQEFARLTADANPLHTDPAFGRTTPFGQINAQGQLMSSLIVGVIGSRLPGPGWFCLGVNADFVQPCFPDEEVVAGVAVKQKIAALNVIVWDGWLKRRADDTVFVRATIKTKLMA
jgi:acyl dehydratase